MLLKIGNLSFATPEQISYETTFCGRFRVQREIDPADRHVLFFLQAFNTNCTEITPGSREVREHLND
ncbi:MAG: hypothetical protein ACI96P_001100 [Candidatus Azotimanducaceae bacterium]